MMIPVLVFFFGFIFLTLVAFKHDPLGQLKA